jgi:Na+-driven multidrug efflux pump
MNSKSNAQAMETEKIPRLLVQLAIPAVVAQIINLLYNIVDRIYIGHIPGVGAAALTGVGLFTPILMLMAAALTVIFFTFAPQLLTMFGASDKTLPYGVDYARIYILGSIFVLIVMGMNPFITTQGFAKISMMTTVIGAIINIILDPIFIFVFHLGVKGAALATVLSQAVGAIWILRFLSGKKTILHLKKENFKLQKEIILP